MADVKVFDKANSFVAIRQRDRSYEQAHERIVRLHAQLPDSDDYQTTILRRACSDLLSAQTHGPLFTLRDHVVEELRRHRDDELPRYLFYRYRYDMFPVLQQLDQFPPCLQVEPTSICNYRCVFCYQTDADFTKPKNGHLGMMSLDLFKRVVDQAEGACEAITLASRGEPLMCPDIDQMLAYASGKFLALKINTNAWYLNERKAHAILQADVNTLVFSADAAAEPLYSRLRVRGQLDRIVANIELFNRIRARDYSNARLITRVSGVRFCTEQSVDDMEGFWGGMVDQVAFVDYNPWENTYERPVNDIRTACSDLWRRMFVWWDGTVNPCDVDYKSTLAVGRTSERSLSDLWRSEPYASLRERHGGGRRGAASPCNRCTVV